MRLMHVKCLRMALNCPSSIWCAHFFFFTLSYSHRKWSESIILPFWLCPHSDIFQMRYGRYIHCSFSPEICILPLRIKNTDTHTIAPPFNESTLLYNVSHSILKNKVLHLTVCQARFVHLLNTLPHSFAHFFAATRFAIMNLLNI